MNKLPLKSTKVLTFLMAPLYTAGLIGLLSSNLLAADAATSATKTAEKKSPLGLSVSFDTGRVVVQEKGVDATLDRSHDIGVEATYALTESTNVSLSQGYSFYPDADNSKQDPAEQMGETTLAVAQTLIKADDNNPFGLSTKLTGVKYRHYAYRDLNQAVSLSLSGSWKATSWLKLGVTPATTKYFPKYTYNTFDEAGLGSANFRLGITESVTVGPFYKTTFSSSFGNTRTVYNEGRLDGYSYRWTNALAYQASDALAFNITLDTLNDQLQNNRIRAKKPFDYEVTNASVGVEYTIF